MYPAMRSHLEEASTTMRTRFRRRSRKASWAYANQQSLSLSGAVEVAYAWLLPPARAQFLMETKQRNTITFAGCHIWLDLYWKLTGSSTGIPDLDFSVFKTTITDPAGGTPDTSPVFGQWDQPGTPGALTSWDEDDDDGTNSFLWQHHVKGSTPPNAVVNTGGGPAVTAASPAANQSLTQLGGSVDGPTYVCRKFFVTQEWQPDIVVRSKRRLQKGEGILFVMSNTYGAMGTGMTAAVNMQYRTLTK